MLDIESINTWIDAYGYWAVALGTFWDASGLQLFVVGGGVAAGTEHGMSLAGVALFGAIGSLTSDLILYGIGRWRAPWLDRIVRSEKGRIRLQIIGNSMQRYAWPLIVFGRFMPWFGRFVPAAAGLRRVKSSRVLPSAATGSLLAASFYACIGYFAGGIFRDLEGYSLWIVLGLFLLSVPIAVWILKRFDREVQRRIKASREG